MIGQWLWRLRCARQGWQARRRGDFDLGVNGPHGREVFTQAEAIALRDALASGRIARRKIDLPLEEES